MRIDIKTVTPVKDNDIRALYLIKRAMELSIPRMRQANLDFVLGRDWEEFNYHEKTKKTANKNTST